MVYSYKVISFAAFLWPQCSKGYDFFMYYNPNGDNRTKNQYSNRVVPLFPRTKELLQKYLEINKSTKPFYHTKNYISKILNEVLNKLNIKGITMHSLRHTFVTRCQEKNVPLYILKSWIGHVQGSAVTTKVYTHKQKDAELDAINKVIV